jgi:hypothetical protein
MFDQAAFSGGLWRICGLFVPVESAPQMLIDKKFNGAGEWRPFCTGLKA